MASQAGENSQTNDPEHTIVSSILTDLIFRRNRGSRNDIYGQYTVSIASIVVPSDTNNLDDWTVQGFLPSHPHDSGNLERAGSFFTVMSNDGGNVNNPGRSAACCSPALPQLIAMNVNVNGIMDSPRLVATA